jgi:hypothetical protein
MIHSYRIALIYMLMCNLSVCLVQLICNIIFLPPILSGFQVLLYIYKRMIMFLVRILKNLIHKKGHFFNIVYYSGTQLLINS